MSKVEAPLSTSSCSTHVFCGASIFDIFPFDIFPVSLFPSYLNSDTCAQLIYSDNNKKSDMPKEFSIELKAVYFRVIHFVEKEKNGPTIPLNLTTARILALLGISKSSLFNLKAEMKTQREQLEKEEDNLEEEENSRFHLRSRTSSVNFISSSSPMILNTSFSSSTDVETSPNPIPRQKRNFSSSCMTTVTFVPSPIPPKKKTGRHRIHLYNEADEQIRVTFHLLLAEKTYPTTKLVLDRLLGLFPDFPITNRTSLWSHLKRLGFLYRTTAKTKVHLDAISFMTQRAAYFRKLDELRQNKAIIFYHGETWTNQGEEKRSVWVDQDGIGRIRRNDGKGSFSANNTSSLRTLLWKSLLLIKNTIIHLSTFLGKRIAISAMINENGFGLSSIYIFDCDSDNSMNSDHFIEWIKRAASELRHKFGQASRICIIIDNATWHSELTDDTKPPKHAWCKEQIQKWLENQNIKFNPVFKKVELTQLAFSNLPSKRYKVDEAAKLFNVEILRLPIKHCLLNPMELAW